MIEERISWFCIIGMLVDMASDSVTVSSQSVLPLRAVARSEVSRLRAFRVDLKSRRDAIDRELATVDQLLKTYVSYDPSLRSADDVRRPRAHRLGETLSHILQDRSNEWLSLAELARVVADKLPGVKPRDASLRNALYHLVKTRYQISSRDSDQGIQYSYSEPQA